MLNAIGDEYKKGLCHWCIGLFVIMRSINEVLALLQDDIACFCSSFLGYRGVLEAVQIDLLSVAGIEDTRQPLGVVGLLFLFLRARQAQFAHQLRLDVFGIGSRYQFLLHAVL